jgi:hypothetical protein
MKIIRILWLVLLCIIFSVVLQNTSRVLATEEKGNRSHQEMFPDDYKNTLSKIMFTNRIPNSREICILRETSIDGKTNWNPTWRTEAIFDNTRKDCILRMIKPSEENINTQYDTTIYQQREKITIVRRISKRDALLMANRETVEIGNVTISKGMYPDILIFRNTDFSPLCANGMHLFDCMKELTPKNITHKIYGNKECLFITINNNDSTTEFIFDSTSGQMLRRSFREKNGTEYESFEYSNFVIKNNFQFPTLVMIVYLNTDNGKRYYTRAKIDVEKCEFNKNYPKSLFIPKLPDGAQVIDEIEKRKYKVNNLTARERDNAIASQLDKIFEEENNKETITNQK